MYEKLYLLLSCAGTKTVIPSRKQRTKDCNLGTIMGAVIFRWRRMMHALAWSHSTDSKRWYLIVMRIFKTGENGFIACRLYGEKCRKVSHFVSRRISTLISICFINKLVVCFPGTIRIYIHRNFLPFTKICRTLCECAVTAGNGRKLRLTPFL